MVFSSPRYFGFRSLTQHSTKYFHPSSYFIQPYRKLICLQSLDICIVSHAKRLISVQCNPNSKIYFIDAKVLTPYETNTIVYYSYLDASSLRGAL